MTRFQRLLIAGTIIVALGSCAQDRDDIPAQIATKLHDSKRFSPIDEFDSRPGSESETTVARVKRDFEIIPLTQEIDSDKMMLVAGGALGVSGETKNGGVSQTVTFEIVPVNDLPVVDADKTLSVLEDTAATPLVIAAPSDADGDALTITVDAVPDVAKGTVRLAAAEGGSAVTAGQILTVAQLGRLEFVPAADANGAAGEFSYTVADGGKRRSLVRLSGAGSGGLAKNAASSAIGPSASAVSGPMRYVVIGSFANLASAADTVFDHRDRQPTIVDVLVDDRLYHRVVVGPLQPAAAREVRRQLIAEGARNPWIVKAPSFPTPEATKTLASIE